MTRRPKPAADEPRPDDRPVPSQLDKFKAAARELGTDDDPERFKERVKAVAKPPASDAHRLKR